MLFGHSMSISQQLNTIYDITVHENKIYVALNLMKDLDVIDSLSDSHDDCTSQTFNVDIVCDQDVKQVMNTRANYLTCREIVFI